jgi:hypothetical protein
MGKVTLIFPSYDSMWLFKGLTKAIHIRIEPRKHIISGLFDANEIEMAVTKFHAILHKAEFGVKVLTNAEMRGVNKMIN